MKLINPFEIESNWYKANLHTHTTSSDGSVSPQGRVEQYREKGYSILALTDHRLTNNVRGLSSEDFLVISGIETHPPIPGTDELYHLVGLNLPFGFRSDEGRTTDAKTQIKLIKDAGGEVIVAHPYWIGNNINELLAIDGYIGIEVYNATSAKIGKACSSVHWDNLLDAGRIVPAIAVDDVHQGPDLFAAWTMIRAKSLEIEAIMDALRTGSYYSSCGPTIEDFRTRDGVVTIKCSPAAEIHFMCNRWHGQSFYTDNSPLLTHAEFKPSKEAKYVRGEIVDEKRSHAWTNPIMLDLSTARTLSR
jgi:hypothetical protein